MPLNTLHLSFRPKKRGIPQVVKVLTAALLAWGLVIGLAWVV
jgi:hypothetical protein